MIWVRKQDIGREVVIQGNGRGRISDRTDCDSPHYRYIVVSGHREPGYWEMMEEYYLDWAEPEPEDIDFSRIPEALEYYERFRAGLKAERREKRKKKVNRLLDTLSNLGCMAVIGIGLLGVTAGLFYLVYLAFKHPGGTPPWVIR